MLRYLYRFTIFIRGKRTFPGKLELERWGDNGVSMMKVISASSGKSTEEHVRKEGLESNNTILESFFIL